MLNNHRRHVRYSMTRQQTAHRQIHLEDVVTLASQ